jgi:hypothetical protein
MIKEIPKSDVITRPMKVYKEWPLDKDNIYPIFGINGANTLVDIDNDAKSYGFNKKVIYASTKSQFYTNSATASIITEVGRRKSYASTDERVLENEIAVFSIPQSYYGEGIKPGTVVFTNNSNITSTTFTDDSYSNLIDSGSNVAGNIFYDRGLIVLTRDITSGSGAGNLTNFTLNFRSTKTIFENEVFIPVLESEFNYSQNPSAVYEDGARLYTHIMQRPGSTKIGDLVTSSFYDAGIKWVKGAFNQYEASSSLDQTGSFLAPMITTIALYDNELNMVAVAKLPQPIKSLPDYPVNFIIRFDT